MVVGLTVAVASDDREEKQADTMATDQRSNKLRDGPCAEHYIELEKCAIEKNITSSHMVSLLWTLDMSWI